MSKFDVGFNEGKLNFGIDLNEDGDKLIKGSLHLNEAIQEAFAKGQKIEGVKVVDFSFEMTKLKLKLDTDQDGQELLELEIDLAEGFDEAQMLLAKKPTV